MNAKDSRAFPLSSRRRQRAQVQGTSEKNSTSKVKPPLLQVATRGPGYLFTAPRQGTNQGSNMGSRSVKKTMVRRRQIRTQTVELKRDGAGQGIALTPLPPRVAWKLLAKSSK